MFSRRSIQLKFSLVFFLTVLLIATALLSGLYLLKMQILRNEASAVASQVVSFRSWVAKSGMVWVDNLSKDFHDYLDKREDEYGNNMFGKNPALATRELSKIANDSSTRTSFRVTSDEYRHADNAPNRFEASAIKTLKSSGDLKYVEELAEGSYNYAQPIYVKKGCLKCHGDPADAPRAVIEKYGDKKAFGYKVGDVRGIISVKLPDLGLREILGTLANPYTIGLLLLAFMINFLFTQFGIIKRMRRLTEQAKAIAGGDLEVPLEFNDPKHSKDEVDHLHSAVDLLRNSLQVAMRRMSKRKH